MKAFHWTRYMYLIQQKESLPTDKVQVPIHRKESTPMDQLRRLSVDKAHLPCPSEGFHSNGQGTCILSIGRLSFWWMWYMYLVHWKGFPIQSTKIYLVNLEGVYWLEAKRNPSRT
jgi:hypothetical protein